MTRSEFSNGIGIDFVFDQDRFLGIGAVAADGVALRDPARPMFVEIRNPSGIELLDYRLEDFTTDSSGARLTFSASRQQGGLMEWMVHSVRNRRATTDWTMPPAPAAGTSLEMILLPVERRIGGSRFTGFSYQYKLRSDDIPIYKILDRGTWEPSGSIVGCEFWMRNCFVPSRVAFADEGQFYSTEWYLPEATNPSIFQFLPLQTELQGFTFTAGKAGTLVTWATRVAHVRSLFEKPRRDRRMVHWHEHCGDLEHQFAASPVEVLWRPGGLDHVQRVNAYHDTREMVHDALHEQIGMRRERVGSYGVIEEWGPSDLARYRALGAPKLLAAGVKKIYLANHCTNNMNTWGVSNMCCTVDHKIAESVGQDNVRAFCQTANAGGAKVEMWANTALSVLTEIFRHQNGTADKIQFLPADGGVEEALRSAKAPYVRNPSNAMEADHYTPVFAVLNLRDATMRDYWMRCWTDMHERVGLEGVFMDSSFNLSSDKFHWAQNTAEGSLRGATADQTALLGNFRPEAEPPAAILSQYMVFLELMTAMQRVGYEYCNEDLGVFGIHRHGPAAEKRIDSLPIWADCLTDFNAPAIAAAGHDPFDIFFRGLAYRMMWIICWDIQTDALSFHNGPVFRPEDAPTPAHLALLQAFNRVEPLMRQRHVLPRETGVAYRHGDRAVIWTFTDFEMSFGKALPVTDVLADAAATSDHPRLLRHHIYEMPAEAIAWPSDEL